MHNGRIKRAREQTRIIGPDNALDAVQIAESEYSHKRSRNRPQLHVRKRFSDAAVPARSKRQVRAAGTFGDEAVAVVDLFVVRVWVEYGERRADVPAMGLPGIGVGEMGGRFGRHARSGEHDVRGGDREVGPGNLDGRLDFAHHGMDRRVQPEGLLDHLRVEREALQRVIGQRWKIFPEDRALFRQQLLEDVRSGGESEDDPRNGRG